MAKKGRTVKLALAGFGLAILVSGLASFINGIGQLPMAIVLGFAAIILFGQVAVKKLIDSKIDVDTDGPSLIALLLAVALFAGAITVGFGWDIPTWLSPIVAVGTTGAGALIIFQAMKK